ncbi:MAG: hypothetical protein J3K34DRAFT_407130 [Monoraphidium minutum]|nr:MAG: hypothetical protein J3K34DRAFT_407130 [Monoraphidium minutum]
MAPAAPPPSHLPPLSFGRSKNRRARGRPPPAAHGWAHFGRLPGALALGGAHTPHSPRTRKIGRAEEGEQGGSARAQAVATRRAQGQAQGRQSGVGGPARGSKVQGGRPPLFRARGPIGKCLSHLGGPPSPCCGANCVCAWRSVPVLRSERTAHGCC